MNEIYNKILKILNVRDFDDIEFLECFSDSNNSKLPDSTINEVISLLNDLRKECDDYAPYYLYLFKKYTKGCDENLMIEYLEESCNAGYLRAVIKYFRYLFDKFDSLAFNTNNIEQLEDIYLNLTILVINNKDRIFKSKIDNDRYYTDEFYDFKYYIDGMIEFYKGHQNYLTALAADKSMTIEIAKNFVIRNDWFSIFIYNIPEIKEFYIKVLNWLVGQKEYDYYLELMSFEKKCKPLFPYGKWLHEARVNQLAFLQKGALEGSNKCAVKYFEILDEDCFEYRYKGNREKKHNDALIYKALEKYYKNDESSKGWKNYINYLVNNYNTQANLARYEECYALIVETFNRHKKEFLNGEYECKNQLFYLCYAFSHNVKLKNQEKCLKCLELFCAVYFDENNIDDSVAKGIGYVGHPFTAICQNIDTVTYKRLNLLKEKKYKEYVDSLFSEQLL